MPLIPEMRNIESGWVKQQASTRTGRWSLPFSDWYARAGCDTVSAFAGRGKLGALKLMR